MNAYKKKQDLDALIRKCKQYSKDTNSTKKKKSKKQSKLNSKTRTLTSSIHKKHDLKIIEYEKLLLKKRDEIKNLENKLKKKNIEKLLQNETGNENDTTYKSIQNTILTLKNEKKKIDSEYLEYLLESSQIVCEYITLGEAEAQEYRKRELINEYDMKFLDKKNTMILAETELCQDCNVQLYLDASQADLICPECGLCKITLTIDLPVSYKDAQNYEYKSQFRYDKKSHLLDWLRRLTSSEKTFIPDDLLNEIKIEIKKDQITDYSILTTKQIKKYLKKIKKTEYYDNIITIINRLNNLPPFKLSEQVEDRINIMFQQIREPFERFKPKSRKNFFSYPFILAKFFKILELDEFIPYLIMLKSEEKIREQDMIFEKIVKELAIKDHSINWVFYPSI
jgi:predicted RNA-binding Zn-ribbon protein involved in translation (DUF1610 family)